MNIDHVWNLVVKEKGLHHTAVHGIPHWVRVERNGLYLAERNGANKTVVSLFALFHDCMRVNDNHDHEHGRRGADYARTLRNQLTGLSDGEFELLTFACQHHTNVKYSDDITIGTCWDSDRLDLERIGVKVKALLLNTQDAKELVQQNKQNILQSFSLRSV
jgi:uncharacterized protein